MSRIYFHTADCDGPELSGRERAYMGVLVSELAGAVIGRGDHERLRSLIPTGHYLHNLHGYEFTRCFEVWLNVGGIGCDGRLGDTDLFTLQLNTALRLGGDTLKLLARLHGQCEIHAFIEAADAAWLAEIIDEGITNRVYRKRQGWEELLAFLRSYKSDQPIVTSYSVTESFPPFASVAPAWPDGVERKWDALPRDEQERREVIQDEWEQKPHRERWNVGVAWLRETRPMLRIDPETWEAYTFNNGKSMFDVLASLSESQPAD